MEGATELYQGVGSYCTDQLTVLRPWKEPLALRLILVTHPEHILHICCIRLRAPQTIYEFDSSRGECECPGLDFTYLATVCESSQIVGQ
jgi:hypothetical protein